jgi:hypothetical protein
MASVRVIFLPMPLHDALTRKGIWPGTILGRLMADDDAVVMNDQPTTRHSLFTKGPSQQTNQHRTVPRSTNIIIIIRNARSPCFTRTYHFHEAESKASESVKFVNLCHGAPSRSEWASLVGAVTLCITYVTGRNLGDSHRKR